MSRSPLGRLALPSPTGNSVKEDSEPEIPDTRSSTPQLEQDNEQYRPSNGHLRAEEPHFVSTRRQDSRRIVSDGHAGKENGAKRSRLSGGFLLGSLRSKKRRNASKLGKEDHLTPPSTPHTPFTDESGHIRHSQDRPSTGSSRGRNKGKASSSRMSQTSTATPESVYSKRPSAADARTPESRHASLGADSSEIVRMALSLNESRRLGLSPGQLPAMGPLVASRTTAGSSPIGSHSASAHHRLRTSSSRNSREANHIDSSPKWGSADTPQGDASSGHENAFQFSLGGALGYNVSAGTLLRAEKARAYFELAHEHRRVLDFLPPLKPSSSSLQLGRQYNPLQTLRNRQVRPKGRGFDVTRNGWNQVDQVHNWVDVIQAESTEDDYITGDIAQLPPWHYALGHRARASTSNSVPDAEKSHDLHGHAAWHIDPQELLADAYWLEQDGNKALVENGKGAKLFKNLQAPLETKDRRHRRNTSASISSPSQFNDTSPKTEDATTDSEGDATATAKPKKHAPSRSRTMRMKRVFHRQKPSIEHVSDSSGSEDVGPRDHFHDRDHDEKPNIEPLERHMKNMLHQESRTASAETQDDLDEPTGGQGRRGGVTEEAVALSKHKKSDTWSPANLATSPRVSTDVSRPASPHLSVEDLSSQLQRQKKGSPHPGFVSKTMSMPFAFMHKRANSKQMNHIAVTDFAASTPELPSPSQAENARASKRASAMITEDTRTGSEEDTALRKHESPGSTRFFKGGRIGELVRNEVPHKDVVWKRMPPGQASENRQSRASSHVKSEDDEDSRHRRSLSADDSGLSRYQSLELPSFRSAHSKDQRKLDRSARQEQAKNSLQRRSRFDRLAPLHTGGSVSPNTRDSDFFRMNSNSSAKKRISPSRSPRASDMSTNLKLPGMMSKGKPPVTGLSTVRSEHSAKPGRVKAKRDLADTRISPKDIAYLKSTINATAARAHSFVNRAETPRPHIPRFLQTAYVFAGQEQVPVPRREEHVVSTRLLSRSIDDTLSKFQREVTEFRNVTSADLHARIDDIRDLVGSRLTPTVRSCVDDAESLIAKLTTTHTLAVKQVNENVELLMRSRWRRLRWFRRAGFTLLEWVLIGIMWCIWLIVLVVQIFRTIIVGSIRPIRWALWM